MRTRLRSTSRRRTGGLCVLACVMAIMVGPTPAASATEWAPPDLPDAPELLVRCGSEAISPDNPGDGGWVNGSGSFFCNRVQSMMGVEVCLALDGVVVTCSNGTAPETDSVDATAEAPCVPGHWTTIVVGASPTALTSPSASVAASLIIDNCRPPL